MHLCSIVDGSSSSLGDSCMDPPKGSIASVGLLVAVER